MSGGRPQGDPTRGPFMIRNPIRRGPLLGILFIVTVFILNGAHGLPCSYQNPRVEDVVLGVDLDGETGTLSEERRVKRAIETEFESLRIHLHYDETIRRLSADKQTYVNSTLLPDATGFWEQALMVRRVRGNLLLKRKCNESFYQWDRNAQQLACAKGCAEVTTCGDSTVPMDHLQPCHYCEEGGGCATEGTSGSGIPRADFVLYVSSKDTARCARNDTLAYAAHCQLEGTLDRPVAGHVNLCPSALSTHEHDQEVLVSTVKHEMLHALGFSAGLFAFYRDDKGKPRTKRNGVGKPKILNREKGYYEWDRTTIQTILRTDWWTAEGPVVHPVQVVVTPRVREESRRHFGCDSLEGAELENQGGEGTSLTHWEKRVFENEAMTGTHTQNPVYSRVTFALLEDTGWYRANYAAAEDLHWGNQLGCEFAKASCGEWIAKRRANNSDPAPFCDHIKHDGTRERAVTRCNLQRDSVALCNLVPYTEPLPKAFRNLAYLAGIQKRGLQYYGGSVSLADFCPYLQEFEWKGSEPRRDSRCEIERNQLDNDDILEVYGPSSRCIDFGQLWTEKKCGRVRTYTQHMAGCYEHSCANNTLFIGVFNSTSLYPCFYEGQHVHIRRMVDGWLREGSLSCPKCEEICGDECIPFEGELPDEIGDPPMDEPCSSFLHFSFSSILSIVILLLREYV